MNSNSLIELHREMYPLSHITPDRVNPMIYELLYLTKEVDEPFRKVLVKGTLLEMVSRNYAHKEADDLRAQIENIFDKIYEDPCCLCMMCWCS